MPAWGRRYAQKKGVRVPPRAAAGTPCGGQVSRIRVLVVDDSVVARRIVVESLADDPQIEVVGTAANGRVALTMVEQLAPDVVTMDMEMPVMDGIDTVRALRRRGDRCRIIMFSLVSAHAVSYTHLRAHETVL